MRALWKGAVSFGLVTIPVSLYPATKREELKYRMHFPDELLDVSEFKEPVEKGVSKPEMQMAKQLIASMTSEWKPQQYTDEYREALKKMIEEKIEHGEEQAGPPAKQKKPTNIVDLISVLKQSIQQTESKSKPGKSVAKTRASRRKKAA